ncbi:hypothetical protein F4777DRAFT_535659 [Nemania sp. FL0916]|nr:hypothetical protein F4777DRAFT_535659 [Nemania sp. FL0916]
MFYLRPFSSRILSPSFLHAITSSLVLDFAFRRILAWCIMAVADRLFDHQTILVMKISFRESKLTYTSADRILNNTTSYKSYQGPRLLINSQ